VKANRFPEKPTALSLAIKEPHFNYLSLSCRKLNKIQQVKKKSKDIPVTCCGGPYGCEMLRFPHFIDNQLIDGGKVVSPMNRPPFALKNIPRIFLVLISVRA
jgi:hypothetical protein